MRDESVEVFQAKLRRGSEKRLTKSWMSVESAREQFPPEPNRFENENDS